MIGLIYPPPPLDNNGGDIEGEFYVTIQKYHGRKVLGFTCISFFFNCIVDKFEDLQVFSLVPVTMFGTIHQCLEELIWLVFSLVPVTMFGDYSSVFRGTHLVSLFISTCYNVWGLFISV